MLWLRLLWSSRPVWLADSAQVWLPPRLLCLLLCLLRQLRWLHLLPRLWRPLSRSLRCWRHRICARSALWLRLWFFLCCLFLLGRARLLAQLGRLWCATIPSPIPSVWVRLLRLVRHRLTLHRHTRPWRLCLLLLLVLPRALPRCNDIPGMATQRWGLGQGLLLFSRRRLAAFSRLWALLPRVRPRLVLHRLLLWLLLLLLLQPLRTRRTTTLCLFAAVAHAVLMLLLLLLLPAPLLRWLSSMTTNDDDEGPRARSVHGPRCTPLPGAMHAAVLAAAQAPREGSGCYPVRSTSAETFRLPALELTIAGLGQDSEEEVEVAVEEAPSWLLVGVRLPAPDPQRPAEVEGVHLCGCWAMEVAEGARVPCRHCIKRWRKDPTVVCREELLLPGKCTRCREAHQRCITVSPPLSLLLLFLY